MLLQTVTYGKRGCVQWWVGSVSKTQEEKKTPNFIANTQNIQNFSKSLVVNVGYYIVTIATSRDHIKRITRRQLQLSQKKQKTTLSISFP